MKKIQTANHTAFFPMTRLLEDYVIAFLVLINLYSLDKLCHAVCS